jgi:hypothetical protein
VKNTIFFIHPKRRGNIKLIQIATVFMSADFFYVPDKCHILSTFMGKE